MEIEWICWSTRLMLSIGQGKVKLTPGPTVRLYLPKVVITPSSCAPTRWKLVKTTQSTSKTAIAYSQ